MKEKGEGSVCDWQREHSCDFCSVAKNEEGAQQLAREFEKRKGKTVLMLHRNQTGRTEDGGKSQSRHSFTVKLVNVNVFVRLG